MEFSVEFYRITYSPPSRCSHIFIDGVSVLMGDTTRGSHGSQSLAPSMGDLWTNIRDDLAKMQATLQKVEQGLLQIKAAVQHEQHELALSARLQTLTVVGIQAAALSFLAQRRVREMRRHMLEVALVTVDLGTRGAQPHPVERPSAATPGRYLQVRAWYVSHRRRTSALRQRR